MKAGELAARCLAAIPADGAMTVAEVARKTGLRELRVRRALRRLFVHHRIDMLARYSTGPLILEYRHPRHDGATTQGGKS